MVLYQAKGVRGSAVYPFDKLEPFEYIAQFKPLKFDKRLVVEFFKGNETPLNKAKAYELPFCISGKIKAEKNGSYKRNNDNLIYRDLIFLDYDDIESTSEGFIQAVSRALYGYSYIIYPTIKHTPKKPRYRLVVKPSEAMNEISYQQVVKEIADKIGLPFDRSSFTWSQLQGLPVTTGDPAEYQKIINRGQAYPVEAVLARAPTGAVKAEYKPRRAGQPSMTMRIIDTLLNGFGDEGGRNIAVTRFVGALVGQYVRCDVPTAWELTQIANSVTADPLADSELERTFESIVKTEIRKRGLGLSK